MFPQTKKGLWILLTTLLYLQLPGPNAQILSSNTGQEEAAQKVEARRQALVQKTKQLAQEQEALERLREEKQKQRETLDPGQITPSLLEQARLDVDVARVRLESLELEQEEAQRTLADKEAQIGELEKQLLATKQPRKRKPLEQKLAGEKELLALEKEYLVHLQKARDLAAAHLALAERWARDLQELRLRALEAQQSEALEEIKARIEKEQNDLQERANALRDQLAKAREGQEDTLTQQRLELRLQELEERMRLKQTELSLAQTHSELKHLAALVRDQELPLAELKTTLEQVANIVDRLKATQDLLQKKGKLFAEKKQVAEKKLTLRSTKRPVDREEARIFAGLVDLVQKQEKSLASLMEAALARRDALQNRYAQTLKQDLLVRTRLPWHTEDQHQIGQDLQDLPRLIVREISHTLAVAATTLTHSRRGVFFLVLEAALLALVAALARTLQKALGALTQREPSFTAQVLLTFLRVLRPNLLPLLVGGSLLLFLFLGGAPAPGKTLLVAVVLVAVGGKWAYDLSWWLLAAPDGAPERQRPKLHRRLSRALILASVLVALTALVHRLPVSPPFQSLVDRIFFFFLALAILPILRSRNLLLESLTPKVPPRWLRVVRLLSLLWPLVLMWSAVPGLMGYLNLAWAIAIYTALSLLVLSLWLVACGLIQDLSRVFKAYVEERFAYGPLWTQGVLDPLQKLLRVLLLVVGLFLFVPPPTGLEGLERTLLLALSLILVLVWCARFCLILLGQLSEHHETIRQLHTALQPLVKGLFIVTGVGLLTRYLVVPDEITGETTRTVLAWLMTSGLRLAFIGALSYIALGIARGFADNLGNLIQRTSPSLDREKRAQTLSHMTRVALSVFILTLAAMLTLRELGVEIGPLIATAGIGGLAIGFGAQNLVRDVISGFFILLEDQIRVGDVVQIGDKGGLVESVGLRVLILRGLDGSVHIIPNGTIERVTNMTKEFSYALMDVGVSYREDIDEVIEVLKEVAAEMRRDPAFASDILEDLEVLGVDDFADSAVKIRIRLKTRPIQQWRIAREMRRRIKKAFDARDIEIPFPHRTLYMGVPKKGNPPPLHLVQENHVFAPSLEPELPAKPFSKERKP